MTDNKNRCEGCSQVCCTTEPIFLTQYDIDIISRKKNLPKNKFVIEKEGYERPIKLMRLNENGDCIFFRKHKEGKNCLIYNFRPLDCRLYPLDIDIRNERYFLISYNHCDFKNEDSEELKKRVLFTKSKIIPLLKPDIKEYAKLRIDLYKQKRWITIEELT